MRSGGGSVRRPTHRAGDSPEVDVATRHERNSDSVHPLEGATVGDRVPACGPHAETPGEDHEDGSGRGDLHPEAIRCLGEAWHERRVVGPANLLPLAHQGADLRFGGGSACQVKVIVPKQRSGIG